MTHGLDLKREHSLRYAAVAFQHWRDPQHLASLSRCGNVPPELPRDSDGPLDEARALVCPLRSGPR